MRFPIVIGSGLLLFGLSSGCVSGKAGGVKAPSVDDLRAQATRYWEAQAHDDWKTTWEYEDPAVRAKSTVDDYARWKTEKEPFRIHAYRLLGVEAEGSRGWVRVECTLSARKFPSAPQRNVTRWERWQVQEGQWRPVPGTAARDWPEAPSQRDRVQEARLRARFDEAWAARRSRDAARYYTFLEPEDRETIPAEAFIEAESQHVYLGCAVDWVEVVGQRGRVRVTYQAKLDDPHLKKMQPSSTPITENWVRKDGQWYLDLLAGQPATASAPAPAGPSEPDDSEGESP